MRILIFGKIEQVTFNLGERKTLLLQRKKSQKSQMCLICQISANWTSLAAGSHKIIVGNGGSGESAQSSRLQLPSSPTIGDTIEVHCLALIYFRLPTTGSTSLYVAVHNEVNNNKTIVYNVAVGYKHGFITYTETPGSSGQFRWLSTEGVLS